jgi:hypothetical protein
MYSKSEWRGALVAFAIFMLFIIASFVWLTSHVNERAARSAAEIGTEITLPSSFQSQYTEKKFSRVAFGESRRWGRYPIYETVPSSRLPESFEVKSMSHNVCKHYSNEIGTSWQISAFGLEWKEYNGKWIAFPRLKTLKVVGYGRHSLSPGYYPQCAAGFQTDNLKYKVYVGDLASLMAQHNKEKSAYLDRRNREARQLQKEIEKVGI